MSCSSCSSEKLAKSSQIFATLESSSIQITEPIVKFHTILEMGSHDESTHTLGSSLQFLEVPQKWGTSNDGHYGTSSQLYDYEDDFQINSNYTFFRKTADVGREGGCDKTRQDMEQGSILPTRADKLMGLHGPNN